MLSEDSLREYASWEEFNDDVDRDIQSMARETLELRAQLAEANRKLAALDWTLITAENLPKVGDMVLLIEKTS